MPLQLNASISGSVTIPTLTGSLLGSASYSITASFGSTAQQLVNYPIFQNGKSKFAWTSYFNGDPTGSGAVKAGNATFITTNIYDGVRLTTNAANQSGSVYWSGSAVSVENGPVWVTFWTKSGAGALGTGTFFYFNAGRPITGSTFTNIMRNDRTMGISTFVDIIDTVGATTNEFIRVYNQTGSNNTRTFLVNDDIGKVDLWNRFDMLFFKSASNYYGNYWMTNTTQSVATPSQMYMPFLLPSQDGTPAVGSNSLLNFGTVWPTGSFLGVHGFTGASNSELFANSFEIRSGYLLPPTYQSSLNFGGFNAGGFS